jgi:hypothetical protein
MGENRPVSCKLRIESGKEKGKDDVFKEKFMVSAMLWSMKKLLPHRMRSRIRVRDDAQ